MPATIATFLARPGEFFERRSDRLDGVRGAGIAAALALVTTVALGALLWLFSRQFDGTATVDNPDYPGETLCEAGFEVATPAGCSEPATRTVEVSSLLWEQVVDVLPVAFVGLLIVWGLLAAALHVGALLAGGDGRIGQTLELAAWGLLPTVVSVVVAGTALVAFAARADLSTGDPEALLGTVEAIGAGVSGLSLLGIQLAGAAWQAYVWTAGLRVVHGISRVAAAAISVLVATVPVLLG